MTLNLLPLALRKFLALPKTIKDRPLREASVQSGLPLRTILDSLGEGVYVLDNEGKLTYLNATGEQLLGWTFAELEGRAVHDIIHHHTPDGRLLPAAQCPIHLAMRNDRIYRSDDEMFFTKTGVALPVAVTGAPLLLGDNRIGSVAAFRDMRAQHDLIEKMAAAQDKLFDAREKALEGARTKSEFLSMMSHEIRTPLNGVIGMIDLLLDTHLDTEQQELAAISKDSAKQLLSVINDILDFSKIEAGKLDIEQLPFDFPLTVESSVDLITTRAREKGLLLTCFVDPAIPTRLIGDPSRIRQILLNFLSNAVKFTEAGEVSVRATIESTTDTLQAIKITIKDNGIGMTPDTLTRLFQPFSQADMSTTRKYGGTGLGLSISKQLAELMGGTVGAISHPEHGSTFWVTLNLPAAPPESSLPLEDIRGRRLVIVGECLATCEGLAAYARAWGLEVITVPTFDITALTTHDRWSLVNNETTRQSGMCCSTLTVMACATPYHETCPIDPHPHPNPPLEGEGEMLLPLQGGGREGDGGMCSTLIDAHVLLLIDPLPSPTLPPLPPSLPVLVCLTQHDTQRRTDLLDQGVRSVLIAPVKQSAFFNALYGALHHITNPMAAPTPSLSAPVQPKEYDSPCSSRILLAEDNAINQKVASRLLGKLGCCVDIANNGSEAVRLWQTGHYALILMDVQMPEMDGFEATQAIRKIEASENRRRHTPIIAMTANAMTGDRERCLSHGMDDYLSKPIDPPRLQAVLNAWLPLSAHTPPLRLLPLPCLNPHSRNPSLCPLTWHASPNFSARMKKPSRNYSKCSPNHYP
ncbi:MAG: ATP-binding protein [Rhodocyclaceae bacterium]|nr:ATP-binding protein [Rhodocyclaceae bacterium]